MNLSAPYLTVKASELNSLSNMGGFNVGRILKVGNGAGNSENFIVCSCGKIQLFKYTFKHNHSLRRGLAEFFCKG